MLNQFVGHHEAVTLKVYEEREALKRMHAELKVYEERKALKRMHAERAALEKEYSVIASVDLTSRQNDMRKQALQKDAEEALDKIALEIEKLDSDMQAGRLWHTHGTQNMQGQVWTAPKVDFLKKMMRLVEMWKERNIVIHPNNSYMLSNSNSDTNVCRSFVLAVSVLEMGRVMSYASNCGQIDREIIYRNIDRRCDSEDNWACFGLCLLPKRSLESVVMLKIELNQPLWNLQLRHLIEDGYNTVISVEAVDVLVNEQSRGFMLMHNCKVTFNYVKEPADIRHIAQFMYPGKGTEHQLSIKCALVSIDMQCNYKLPVKGDFSKLTEKELTEKGYECKEELLESTIFDPDPALPTEDFEDYEGPFLMQED